ncbi:Nudix hydrolase 21 [Diplonema papillatum]|nr:Nudix hydrolase 21 [Diplonema papillatum]
MSSDGSPLQPARRGREKQRYHADGRRLCAGGVVIRKTEGAPQILLISSTYNDDWTLPKGGWETDETVEEAAMRETREEAGVDCQLGPSLGEFEVISSKGNKSLWTMFVLHETAMHDDWAESTRKRKYFTMEEAKAAIRANTLPVLLKVEAIGALG